MASEGGAKERPVTKEQSPLLYTIGTGQPTRTGRFLVKIGTAKDPPRRLADLQTGSPVPLRLLASAPGDRVRERALHIEFHRYRQHGEWFALPRPELVRLLAILRGTEELRRPKARQTEGRAERLRRERERRAERLRWRGILPRDGSPRASAVTIRTLVDIIEVPGPFGALWSFTCPGCGCDFPRTSEAAARRWMGQHVIPCQAS